MALDPIKLVRSIPSVIGVIDPEAQRVLGALTEALRYLVLNGRKSTAVPDTPGDVGVVPTILGESPIVVTTLPSATFRISFMGETSGSGGGALVYFGAKSIDVDGVIIELVNDELAPGADKMYGTDGSGDKGWQDIATVDHSAEDPGVNVDTLGAASEGTETALSDSWSVGGSGNGLAIYKVTRTVYNHAGDKKLYEFLRLFTYDDCGRLYSVSAETRVEVDAAVQES